MFVIHGATLKIKKLGHLVIFNFSFYYAHHMSTIEGGMIVQMTKMYMRNYVFCGHTGC